MDNNKLLELAAQAKKLLSEKNWEELLSVSSEIIKLKPKDDNAYVYRGIAKINLSDYKGAINDYTKAIKIKPNNDDAYVNRGTANAKSNDFQDAINDYDKALKINPKNDHAYVGRSFAKEKLGDFQGEMDDCNKALKINPKNDHAYVNRGVAKSKLGDPQGAIGDYNKALEINPKNDRAYANRGVAKEKLGDPQGAIEDFDKALGINSNNIKAIHNRGAARALIESKIEQTKTIKKLDEEYKKQIANHEKQLVESQKEQKETIKKINEEYEKQLSDHNEQLQHANRYKELAETYKREFNCLSKKKKETMTEIKDMVIQSLVILIVYLLCIFIFTDTIVLFSFLPALTMASLYLFPQIWSMRNIERDRNRYWALHEDAYTKWILTLSAHLPSTKKLLISKKLREKLLLKLFEHHNNSNTQNIILSKHGESGKSDINNIVRNFASQKDEE